MNPLEKNKLIKKKKKTCFLKTMVARKLCPYIPSRACSVYHSPIIDRWGEQKTHKTQESVFPWGQWSTEMATG